MNFRNLIQQQTLPNLKQITTSTDSDNTDISDLSVFKHFSRHLIKVIFIFPIFNFDTIKFFLMHMNNILH